MVSFDDLNAVLEIHHHDEGEARAFLLRSAATSSDCGPLSWLLSLFELKGGSLSGAWSGGWVEQDVHSLLDLMPDATADVFAKRLGQELADGGAFLEITTTSASIIKLKIQNPVEEPVFKPFVVRLRSMPESDWLSEMTAFAADSRLSIDEQRIRLLERELQQERVRADRAEAASQSPIKSQVYVDFNAGRPKGMSMANPNIKEARRTEGGPFDHDSDESDDEAKSEPTASTSKPSPTGAGSVADPGGPANVTPPSPKGKRKATRIDSETDSDSENEETLGSPTKRKSKRASSVLRPGPSPTRKEAIEPESFSKTLAGAKAKRPLNSLFDSDSSGDDAPKLPKRNAIKNTRMTTTAAPTSITTVSPTPKKRTTALSKAQGDVYDFDDDGSHTEDSE